MALNDSANRIAEAWCVEPAALEKLVRSLGGPHQADYPGEEFIYGSSLLSRYCSFTQAAEPNFDADAEGPGFLGASEASILFHKWMRRGA